jgi:hypothetical protein
VVVNRDSYPFLDGHRIQDVPVFPVVGALDLFFRGYGPLNGSRPLCRNLRVLRGIRLESFEHSGTELVVRNSEDGLFEILGSDGTRHFEARLADHNGHADPSHVPAQFQKLERRELEPWPYPDQEIYERLLFHGPSFQVIQGIEGVSKQGIAGLVVGSRAMQWQNGHHRCDPALLDGGLQLARLWGFYALGKPSLPAAIASAQIFMPESPVDTIRCEVLAKESSASKFVFDIHWTSLQGDRIASMEGVEMYALPESKPSATSATSANGSVL